MNVDMLFKKFGLVSFVINGEFNSQNVRKSTRTLLVLVNDLDLLDCKVTF